MTQQFRTTTRFAFLSRSHGECPYCGCHISINHHHLDHVVPRAKGGSNRPSNVVACCPTCNTRKGDLSLSRFAARLAAEKATRKAIYTAPHGATAEDVAVLAAQLAGEMAGEIVARVRRQTRRTLPRALGRMLAARYVARRVTVADAA